jgi:hypothetical protein
LGSGSKVGESVIIMEIIQGLFCSIDFSFTLLSFALMEISLYSLPTSYKGFVLILYFGHICIIITNEKSHYN